MEQLPGVHPDEVEQHREHAPPQREADVARGAAAGRGGQDLPMAGRYPGGGPGERDPGGPGAPGGGDPGGGPDPGAGQFAGRAPGAGQQGRPAGSLLEEPLRLDPGSQREPGGRGRFDGLPGPGRAQHQGEGAVEDSGGADRFEFGGADRAPGDQGRAEVTGPDGGGGRLRRRPVRLADAPRLEQQGLGGRGAGGLDRRDQAAFQVDRAARRAGDDDRAGEVLLPQCQQLRGHIAGGRTRACLDVVVVVGVGCHATKPRALSAVWRSASARLTRDRSSTVASSSGSP